MQLIKRHGITILIILILLLGGLQPILIRFDFLQEEFTNLTHLNFWHLTLFASDGSLMILGILPVIVLWQCNQSFFYRSHRVASFEDMDDTTYQTAVHKQLQLNYKRMTMITILFILLIFGLPFLRPDGLLEVGIGSVRDVVTILLFTISTLFATLSIVNLWMLFSRKRWAYPITILVTLFLFYFACSIYYELALRLLGPLDNLILEALLGMSLDKVLDHGISSHLVLPTSFIANLSVFWISYYIVHKKFQSVNMHIRALRQPVK